MKTSAGWQDIQISRGAFLRGIGLLGASTTLLGGGLWSTVARSEDDQPKAGGTLTYNLTGDVPNFDPISNSSSTVMSAIGPCYNGLVREDTLDPNKIAPDLAKSWDVSPTGDVFTFHLTENVKFHDGKPLTANDVKYTFDYIRNPPQGVVSARKGMLEGIKEIKVIDDLTVEFRLAQPNPSFVLTLANAWLLVLPKHLLESGFDFKTKIVGSGPFKLKKYSRGVSLQLEKNKDYFVAGRPYLDAITCYVIPDQATTLSYLMSGQLLMYIVVRGDAVRQLRQQNVIKLQESPSTSVIAVTYNATKAPFDKLEVRQAASLAIDRAGALQVAQQGNGELGGVSMPGPWSLPGDVLQKIPGYGLDVEANRAEAKRLLAAAGYPNGLTIKLMVRKIALFEPVGVYLKDQWARVGITAEIDLQETASFFTKLQSGDFQVTPNAYEYDANDPNSAFNDFHGTKSPSNFARVGTAEIDALIAKQSMELDPEKRKAIVHELEQSVLKEYGSFYLYWQKRYMGTSPRLHGMVLHPNIDQNMRMQDLWISA